MKNTKKVLTLILALILILSVALPAFADTATATNMRITGIDGTITVKNASGKTVTARNDMKLYSGYTIATEKDSYVYISLDDTKAIKLDKSSNVSIKKNGKKLEVQVVSGSIFFNVTEPLKGDESLNIRTTTMVTGIRGTSGEASVMPADVRLDKNGRPESNMVWDESIMLFTGHAEIVATKSTGVDGARVSTNELEKGVEQGLEAGSEITAENRKEAKNELENIFNPKDTAATEVTVTDVDIYAGEAVVSRTIAVTETTQEYQVEKVAAVKEDISASALEEIIKDEDLQEKIAESTDLITDEEGKIDTEALENLVEEKKEEEEAAVKEKEEAYEEENAKIETETVQDQVFDPVVEPEAPDSGSSGNDYSDPDPTPDEPAPEDPSTIVLSGEHVDAQNYIAALKDETIENVTIDGGRVELTGANCEGDSANIPEGKTITFANGSELLVGQNVTFDVYGTLTFDEGTTFDNAGTLNILSNNSVHIKTTHAAISGFIKIGSGSAVGLLDIQGTLISAREDYIFPIEIANGTINVGSNGLLAANVVVSGNGTKSGPGSIRYNNDDISLFVVPGGNATISAGRVYGAVCSENATLTVEGGFINQRDGLSGASSLNVQGGTVNLVSGSIENSNVNGYAITLSGDVLPNVTLGDNFIIRTKNYQDTPLPNTKWVDDSEDGWYRLIKADYNNLDDPTYAEFVDALAHTNSVTLTNVNKTSRKFVVEENGLSIPNGKTVDIKSGTIDMNGLSITVNSDAALALNGVSITNCKTIDVLKGAKLDIASEINASAEIYNNGITNFKSGKIGCIWNEKTDDSEAVLNISGGELLSTTGTNEDGSTWIHYGLQAGDGSVTTISNAGIGGIGVSPTANVTMESGTVNGDIWTGEDSKLTINGGTVNGSIDVGGKSTLTINGGTVTGNTALDVKPGATVNINGGTISGTEKTISSYGANIIIAAGTIECTGSEGVVMFLMTGDQETYSLSETAVVRTKNPDDAISEVFGFWDFVEDGEWYVAEKVDSYTLTFVTKDEYFRFYGDSSASNELTTVKLRAGSTFTFRVEAAFSSEDNPPVVMISDTRLTLTPKVDTSVHTYYTGTITNIQSDYYISPIYKISYELSDGDSWEEGYTPVDDYVYGDETYLPIYENISRDSAVLDGWLLDGEKVTIINGEIYGNITLIPNWVYVNLVSYNLNQGSWVEGFRPETTYEDGETLTLPTVDNVVREGFEFGGWYADAKFETEITSVSTKGTNGPALTNVYAKWNVVYTSSLAESDLYTITNVKNSGILGDSYIFDVMPTSLVGVTFDFESAQISAADYATENRFVERQNDGSYRFSIEITNMENPKFDLGNISAKMNSLSEANKDTFIKLISANNYKELSDIYLGGESVVDSKFWIGRSFAEEKWDTSVVDKYATLHITGTTTITNGGFIQSASSWHPITVDESGSLIIEAGGSIADAWKNDGILRVYSSLGQNSAANKGSKPVEYYVTFSYEESSPVKSGILPESGWYAEGTRIDLSNSVKELPELYNGSYEFTWKVDGEPIDNVFTMPGKGLDIKCSISDASKYMANSSIWENKPSIDTLNSSYDFYLMISKDSDYYVFTVSDNATSDYLSKNHYWDFTLNTSGSKYVYAYREGNTTNRSQSLKKWDSENQSWVAVKSLVDGIPYSDLEGFVLVDSNELVYVKIDGYKLSTVKGEFIVLE